MRRLDYQVCVTSFTFNIHWNFHFHSHNRQPLDDYCTVCVCVCLSLSRWRYRRSRKPLNILTWSSGWRSQSLRMSRDRRSAVVMDTSRSELNLSLSLFLLHSLPPSLLPSLPLFPLPPPSPSPSPGCQYQPMYYRPQEAGCTMNTKLLALSIAGSPVYVLG